MKFNKYAAKQQAKYWGASTACTILLLTAVGVAETLLTGRSRIWRSGLMEAVTKVGVMATGAAVVTSGLISDEVEKEYEVDLETSQELDKIVANLQFIMQFGTDATKEHVKELISKYELSDIINIEDEEGDYGIIKGFKAVKGDVTHMYKLLKLVNDAFLALEMVHPTVN